MDVFKWPELSPDLNLIKNVWVALSKAVYRIIMQFNSITDLKKTIEQKWACISTSMDKKYIKTCGTDVFLSYNLIAYPTVRYLKF